MYFSKRVSEAGRPDGIIPRHAGLTDRLDYEAELAVVLGRAARDVKAADAAEDAKMLGASAKTRVSLSTEGCQKIQLIY